MEIFELEEGHLGYWATGSGTPVLFVHGVATLGELWAAERREKLLMNAAGIFADFGSGSGSVDESRLASISIPITLVELKLSPPFLRRSCQRLKELLPQARGQADDPRGSAS